jgi:hypothetical protein
VVAVEFSVVVLPTVWLPVILLPVVVRPVVTVVSVFERE